MSENGWTCMMARNAPVGCKHRISSWRIAEGHVWLDVHHRRAVNHIQAIEMDEASGAVHTPQAAQRQAQWNRSVWRSGSEHASCIAIQSGHRDAALDACAGAVTRLAPGAVKVSVLVEEVDDPAVRETFQASQAVEGHTTAEREHGSSRGHQARLAGRAVAPAEAAVQRAHCTCSQLRSSAAAAAQVSRLHQRGRSELALDADASCSLSTALLLRDSEGGLQRSAAALQLLYIIRVEDGICRRVLVVLVHRRREAVALLLHPSRRICAPVHGQTPADAAEKESWRS